MLQVTPLITIYITNYNYGKYIKQSIESLLNQTLQNFELYIIDDGSTDGSKDIIEQYAGHPKISIIYQKNKGLNITNNIALKVAKGKYIMRLDADDYLEHDALEVMSSMLQSNDELGLVFPDYYLVDAANNPIGEVQRFNFKNEVSLLDLPAHGACTMIRREFLLNLGGYDESYSCQDGYELWIKFIAHYKVLNINKPLFYYRQHGNNLTSNETRILETRFKIKDNFILNNNIRTQKTIAVIPVRNTFIKNKNMPLEYIDGISILERVAAAASASKLQHVVITSADKEIIDFYNENLKGKYDKVSLIERPAEFARMNESLSGTIKYILNHASIKRAGMEAIMTLSIEYPFVSTYVIDDALNTLTIFGADSLISVRPDNSTYYQHNGTGLSPILKQDEYTKLEREALYKGVGGIVLSKIGGFLETNKMLHGKIGHIIVDKQIGIGVFSDFDLMLCKKMVEVITPA